MVWVRPLGPTKEFRTLEMENKTTGIKRQFIFQEIPPERYDDVIDLLISGFIRDEAISSSLEICNDPEAVESTRNIFSKVLEQGVSVGAFEINKNIDKPKLVGFNVLQVVTKEDEEPNFKALAAKMKKILDFIVDIEQNIFTRFVHLGGLYLNALGLFVHKDYRGWGLGKKILELRNDLGKVYNIPYSVTVFTSIVSQTLAASVGFRDYITMNYDDVVDKDNGEMLFPNLKGKTIKLMIKNLPVK